MRHYKTLVTMVSLLFLVAACRGGGPNGEDGNGETGEEPCTGCDGTAFACFAFYEGGVDDNPFHGGCAASPGAAWEECGYAYEAPAGPESNGALNWEMQVSACANLEEPDDCLYWEPESFVDYNAGTYEVAEGFIYGLVADPSPLIDCDAARFGRHVSGGYALTGTSTGQLSYELGLRNGDRVLYLNGHDIDNIDEVLEAFAELYYENETEFTLQIVRSSTPMTLQYELMPPVAP